MLKGILTGSLSYAVQPLKYIPFSPAEYIDIPSTRATPKVKTRSAPHVYLSAEQMGKLFQRFPEGSSSYLPLLIGYKCGLRIVEAFALEWKDIDLTAKKLTVRQQILWQEKNATTGAPAYWYFTMPKYDSIRTIELSQDVVGVLERRKSAADSKIVQSVTISTSVGSVMTSGILTAMGMVTRSIC